MHRLFKLGGFCFAADHPDTLVFPPNFLRFETKDVQPAYFYTLRFVKSIPNPVGVCTAVHGALGVGLAVAKEIPPAFRHAPNAVQNILPV